jgi:hypothetical protein
MTAADSREHFSAVKMIATIIAAFPAMTLPTEGSWPCGSIGKEIEHGN